MLRPGGVSAHDGAISILKRTIKKLRKACGKFRIRARLDGGFSSPELLEFLDEQQVEYVLFQELRFTASKTFLANAQVSTLRERLLKLAVWVQRSTRRVVFHLPDAAPWRHEWTQIARALGAVPI